MRLIRMALIKVDSEDEVYRSDDQMASDGAKMDPYGGEGYGEYSDED